MVMGRHNLFTGEPQNPTRPATSQTLVPVQLVADGTIEVPGVIRAHGKRGDIKRLPVSAAQQLVAEGKVQMVNEVHREMIAPPGRHVPKPGGPMPVRRQFLHPAHTQPATPARDAPAEKDTPPASSPAKE